MTCVRVPCSAHHISKSFFIFTFAFSSKCCKCSISVFSDFRSPTICLKLHRQEMDERSWMGSSLYEPRFLMFQTSTQFLLSGIHQRVTIPFSQPCINQTVTSHVQRWKTPSTCPSTGLPGRMYICPPIHLSLRLPVSQLGLCPFIVQLLNSTYVYVSICTYRVQLGSL